MRSCRNCGASAALSIRINKHEIRCTKCGNVVALHRDVDEHGRRESYDEYQRRINR